MDTYRAVFRSERCGAAWRLERSTGGAAFEAMGLYFQTEVDALSHALHLVTLEKQRRRELAQSAAAHI